MAQTPETRAFLIHAAAYVTVNAVLLVLNATQTVEPGETREWWVQWVIAGWGIGLAAHGFALWVERRAREGQLLADENVRGVAVHLLVYLGVNTLLVIVNLTTSPETLWSIWPILIWGVALAGHAYLAYRAVLRKTMQRYAQEQEILTQIQLERQAAEIAAAIAPPETDELPEAAEAPPAEAAPAEEPAPKPKRKRAAAKTTRRTTRKAPTKKAGTKPARSPAKTTTRTKRTTTRTAKAKKPATRRTTRKPASSASKAGEKS